MRNRSRAGRLQRRNGWNKPQRPADQLGSVSSVSWTSGLSSPKRRATRGRGTNSSLIHQEDELSRLRRLEAILFLAKEPLHSRKLSQYANLSDGTEARTLIRKLNAFYDEVGRAFRVEEVAGGFQLLTRTTYYQWLRRFEHVPRPTRLSQPALETLSVIAYQQPVLRFDVESIRGVNCGEVIRQLMERDLVRIAGRSEELGRPYLYRTTRKFLQQFGLSGLDKLPRADIIQQQLLERKQARELHQAVTDETAETGNDAGNDAGNDDSTIELAEEADEIVTEAVDERLDANSDQQRSDSEESNDQDLGTDPA